MALAEIFPDLYAVSFRGVNAFLIWTDYLTLIDTGFPGSAPKILQALRDLGRRPEDIKHILVTHCHGDHAGSLAALKEATGAPSYMHEADAALVREGRPLRPLTPTPDPANRLLFRIILRRTPRVIQAADIEHEVKDGDLLPAAEGIRAIHAPGHCAGQLVFLWPRHGGVLFAADTAFNLWALRLSPAYEDLAEGRRSLEKISGLTFEAACFGHGRTIRRGASAQFRRRWGGLPGR